MISNTGKSLQAFNKALLEMDSGAGIVVHTTTPWRMFWPERF